MTRTIFTVDVDKLILEKSINPSLTYFINDLEKYLETNEKYKDLSCSVY